MQIGRLALRQRQADAIPAPVMVIGGVQRLMHISDEVNEKFERQKAFCGRRGGAREFGGNKIRRRKRNTHRSPAGRPARSVPWASSVDRR